MAVALVALAVTVPLAWMGATPITTACEGGDEIPHADEGGSYETATSVWPPGLDCTTTLSTGRRFHGTYVAWYELTLALVFGAGTYLVTAAALGVIRAADFARGLGATAVVFLCATVGFFL